MIECEKCGRSFTDRGIRLHRLRAHDEDFNFRRIKALEDVPSLGTHPASSDRTESERKRARLAMRAHRERLYASGLDSRGLPRRTEYRPNPRLRKPVKDWKFCPHCGRSLQ